MRKTRVIRDQLDFARSSVSMMAGRSSSRNSTTAVAPAATNPFVLSSRHSDFKKAQEGRPAFNPSLPIVTTRSPNPTWKYGEGAQIDGSQNGSQNPSLEVAPPPPPPPPQEQVHGHTEIDPNAPDR